MAWQDESFGRGEGYGPPSMEDVVRDFQNKIRRWGSRKFLFILFAIPFILS